MELRHIAGRLPVLFWGSTPMNARERFRASLLFEKVDRVPFVPGGGRESTLARWHTEGLLEGVSCMAAVHEELGIRPEKTQPAVSPGVSFTMIPTFEEKVLEHKDGHYVVRDWMGAVTEISDEYDYTYIRSARDFVTRKWHKFPVETREDFLENMKWRYDPKDPKRFPDDFAERCRQMKDRDYTITIGINGPFWQIREWLGFENLCMLTVDNPAFVTELVDFWTGFVTETLKPILDGVQLDCVHFSEDMAYKNFSMISPAMVRKFLLPFYEVTVRMIRQSGCPIVDMDSDGYIGELIPIWIEAGFNVCDPIEVAAGNDIVAFREQFGTKMAYRCGIDKRCIAKGGKVIERELERVVPPLLKEGGFIPGCDHGVPHDVSWPDFLHYCRKLAELTGWL